MNNHRVEWRDRLRSNGTEYLHHSQNYRLLNKKEILLKDSESIQNMSNQITLSSFSISSRN